MHLSTKILGLMISAIRNLRELKGSTSQEILHYISSIYNIPSAATRRQVQTALKRGVAYGILKKIDGHYSLPTDNDITRQEVAVQEIGLLDMYRQQKNRRSRGWTAQHNKDHARRSQRVASKRSRRNARQRSRCGSECGSRSCMRRREKRRSMRKGRCKCRDFGKYAHNRTTELRTEPSLDRDKLTGSNGVTTEAAAVVGIERGSCSSTPSVKRRDCGIPLSY